MLNVVPLDSEIDLSTLSSVKLMLRTNRRMFKALSEGRSIPIRLIHPFVACFHGDAGVIDSKLIY
jgi:hypothetical protein